MTLFFTPQRLQVVFSIALSNIYPPHHFRRFESQSQELRLFALLPAVPPRTKHSPWHTSGLTTHLLNAQVQKHLDKVMGMARLLHHNACPHPGYPKMLGSAGCEWAGEQTVTDAGRRRVTRALRSRDVSWRTNETKWLGHAFSLLLCPPG